MPATDAIRGDVLDPVGPAEAESLLWLGHALVGLGKFYGEKEAYDGSAAIRRDLEQTVLELGAEAGLARVALARGDVATAMTHAEIILDHLDRNESQESSWEPLRIHLTVVEVRLCDTRKARCRAGTSDFISTSATVVLLAQPDAHYRSTVFQVGESARYLILVRPRDTH